MKDYRVRHGGLMRCCTATLDEVMQRIHHEPHEGDTIKCRFCHDEYGMRFRAGAWEWAKPQEQDTVKGEPRV